MQRWTCGVQGILGIPQPINEPPFTLVERDRRWALMRQLMAERGIDVLVVLPEWLTSDAMYIADTHGATVFPCDDEPTLILGGEASNIAVTQPSWIEDRVSATPRGSTAAPYGQAVVEVLRRRGLLGRKIAVAGMRGHALASVRQPDGYACYTTVQAIADAVTEPISDGTPVLAEARYVKSDEEIQRLAGALRVAERSVEAMGDTAAAGIAQAEVFAQMLVAQVRAGADELHVAWAAGKWGEDRHRYHTTPAGTLSAGTYVSVELMPEIRGYQAQVAQPLVVGEACAQAREIFEINARAFDLALGALRPGTTWGEVDDAVTALAEGTPYKLSLLLHGRGLGNDGPLLIPVGSHDFARHFPITENTVFILKPFAEPRDLESVTFTRAHDVTWGDTIVVRKTGAERMGSRPRELMAR
jgi:Xaa-Pro dipeptidase